MSGNKDLNLMNKIATDMVMQQAANDKLDQHNEKEELKKKNEELINMQITRKDEDEIANQDSDDDFNEDMDEDEADLIRRMKESRVQEFESFRRMKNQEKSKLEGTGEYVEVTEEQFFNYTTKESFVVVHFYHQDFTRCKIVDMHLRKIAYLHPECKFISLDVEKAPFLVNKLQIKTLPTLAAFIDGVMTEQIVGFEDFGGQDEFKTEVMTRRLAVTKVIKLKEEEKFKIVSKPKRINKFKGGDSDDSDYYDED